MTTHYLLYAMGGFIYATNNKPAILSYNDHHNMAASTLICIQMSSTSLGHFYSLLHAVLLSDDGILSSAMIFPRVGCRL